MISRLDWHLNCNWMSELLTFSDLNALSLTNKDTALFANGARMLKVKKWEETSNEGEKVWIEYYKNNYPTICNPASLYLKCLRYRHICVEHFRDVVLKDPRLTTKQKNQLLVETLSLKPSKLFYWFVVNILPQRPLKINFSLELLRNTLNLPFGNKVIRRSSVGSIWLFTNKENHIVLSNEEGLIGVITEDAHLWPTAKWGASISKFFSSVCLTTPEQIITGYSSICPFCGLDVCNPCAHSMKCMKNYTSWVVDSSGLDNRLVEYKTK